MGLCLQMACMVWRMGKWRAESEKSVRDFRTTWVSKSGLASCRADDVRCCPHAELLLLKGLRPGEVVRLGLATVAWSW